jgi:hypothetical protein
MPRWSVDLIRGRTQHLGTVEAATAKEAIEKAVKQFEIELPDGIARDRALDRLSGIRVYQRIKQRFYETLGPSSSAQRQPPIGPRVARQQSSHKPRALMVL